MSHDPLDPSADPLLFKLGQLGVPAGGAPSATAAALLSKAAVAVPVVAGLAGVKLYSLLAATLAVGLGGGAVVTELIHGRGYQTAESIGTVEDGEGIEFAEGVEVCDESPGGWGVPWALPPSVDDAIVHAAAEPASPGVVVVTRYIEVPVATLGAAGGATDGDTSALDGLDDLIDDDDWIGEPEVEPAPEFPRSPPDPERVELDPFESVTTSAEVIPTGRRVEGGGLPAEGHLRIGVDGGVATFPDANLGNLSGAVGLELLGPGPFRAAPLLAFNLDAGLISARPLGTLAVDGEVGIALRPRPDLRIGIAAVGGVRFVDRTYWDTYLDGLSWMSPEEERRTWESLPTGALTAPTFGGRIGLVIGDRRRSPLSFRAAFTGQALVFREPVRDTTVLIPRLGGTVGVDILLPPAGN